jgi:DNA-binding NarL/FixJ family response regulator
VIRVLLADDQELVRSGFRLILDLADGIEVAGEARDGLEAVRLAKELQPDVVLMDVRMPEVDGIEATRRLRRAGVDAHVLVLTTFDLDEYVYDALRAGAAGFLLKDAPREQLVAAVRTVARGEALLAPAITQRLIERFVARPPLEEAAPALGELSARELEVLRLLARALERRDRGGARRRRGDREDARGADPAQARGPRPGAGGRLRVRERARRAGRLLTEVASVRAAGRAPVASPG